MCAKTYRTIRARRCFSYSSVCFNYLWKFDCFAENLINSFCCFKSRYQFKHRDYVTDLIWRSPREYMTCSWDGTLQLHKVNSAKTNGHANSHWWFSNIYIYNHISIRSFISLIFCYFCYFEINRFGLRYLFFFLF